MAKTAKALPTPEPSQTLADKINQARQEARDFIEAKVRELKAAPDGQLLPIDWIRQNLYAVNHVKCECKLAQKLIEEQDASVR